MRALRWVLSLILLLAGATADGAEAVKIRASWIAVSYTHLTLPTILLV